MSEHPVTFLLVHGSWHGPWCWDRLVPELERLGHRTRTVALPSVGTDVAHLGDLYADAAAVGAAAAAIDGDVVVVGHSYGGAVITEAAHPANVSHLVYVGAFMPEAGRTFASYLPPGPLPSYVGDAGDGSLVVPAGEAPGAFYGHCDADTVAWAERQLLPQLAAMVAQPLTRTAWRDLASTYVVLTDDHAIPTFLQRSFAQQASATVELDSDHSPMLSHPAELAAALARVATGRGAAAPAA